MRVGHDLRDIANGCRGHAGCCELVESLGGKIIGIAFLIELAFLKGRKKLRDYPIHSILTYES